MKVVSIADVEAVLGALVWHREDQPTVTRAIESIRLRAVNTASVEELRAGLKALIYGAAGGSTISVDDVKELLDNEREGGVG